MATSLLAAVSAASPAISPYDLASFVNTHSNFDWGPIRKTLKIRNDFLLPQCDRCSSAIVEVARPPQTLVMVEDAPSLLRVYLRYRRDSYGNWRVTGTFRPFVKYFRPEHQLVETASRTFLVVTEQGAAGTGLSTKLEHWLDLSRDSFQPSFTFTKEGHWTPAPNGLGWNVTGRVVSIMAESPLRVTVNYKAEFSAPQDLYRPVPMGVRRDTVVYVQSESGELHLSPALSTTQINDLKYFYDIGEPPWNVTQNQACAAFLRFNIESLVKIAATPDAHSGAWLSSYIRACACSDEARRLSAILKSSNSHPRAPTRPQSH